MVPGAARLPIPGPERSSSQAIAVPPDSYNSQTARYREQEQRGVDPARSGHPVLESERLTHVPDPWVLLQTLERFLLDLGH